MNKRLVIPEEIGNRTMYRRKFSFSELYLAYLLVPGAFSRILRNNKRNFVSKQFVERVQLAVTEVNGCAACSYAHTYLALKQGLSVEEIHAFLTADQSAVAPEEAKGILFAQHFADQRGRPSKEAFDALMDEYGEDAAWTLLAAAQLMLVGNIYGLPYSAFVSRLRGKAFEGSSLFYELWMQVVGILVLPLALAHGRLRLWFGYSPVRWGDSETVKEENTSAILP